MKTTPVETILGWVAPPPVFAGNSLPSDDLIRLELFPPLPVRGLDTDIPELVWGRALVERAEAIGVTTVPVQPVPSDERTCLLLALKLERRPGRYSWEEREALYHLMRARSVEIDSEVSFLVTGDGGFADVVVRYLALSPARRHAVANGQIELRMAAALGSLCDEAIDIVGTGRLSFSNRRQLLTWLSETVERDTLDDAASVKLAQKLISSENPVSAARRMRFPRLCEMEDRFGTIQRDLREYAPVELKAPPGFEGSGFELVVRLASSEDVDRTRMVLDRLQEHGSELFGLL